MPYLIDPDTPEEQKAFNDIEQRVRVWAHIACVFAPIIPLYPFWWDLRSLLGQEGAVLIAVVLQLVLVINVPPWISRAVAERRLMRDRKRKNRNR